MSLADLAERFTSQCDLQDSKRVDDCTCTTHADGEGSSVHELTSNVAPTNKPRKRHRRRHRKRHPRQETSVALTRATKAVENDQQHDKGTIPSPKTPLKRAHGMGGGTTAGWRETLREWGGGDVGTAESTRNRRQQFGKDRHANTDRRNRASSTTYRKASRSSKSKPFTCNDSTAKGRSRTSFRHRIDLNEYDFEISDLEMSEPELAPGYDGADVFGAWGGWRNYTSSKPSSSSSSSSSRKNQNYKMGGRGPRPSRSSASSSQDQQYDGGYRTSKHQPLHQDPLTFESYCGRWKKIYVKADTCLDNRFRVTEFPWLTASELRQMIYGSEISAEMANKRRRQLLMLMHPDKLAQKFPRSRWVSEAEHQKAMLMVTESTQLLNTMKR